MKFIIMQVIEISTLKNNKSKNWSAEIFQFNFGQLVYWSEQAKEANLEESIRSSNCYLFHKVNFTI